MPDSDIPALGDHRIAAIAAFAPEAGLRFSTFSVNDSEFEFHFVFPFNGQSTLEAVASRRGAKRRVSLLLVLASRQRWLAGC
jgi:hypothetical protein